MLPMIFAISETRPSARIPRSDSHQYMPAVGSVQRILRESMPRHWDTPECQLGAGHSPLGQILSGILLRFHLDFLIATERGILLRFHLDFLIATEREYSPDVRLDTSNGSAQTSQIIRRDSVVDRRPPQRRDSEIAGGSRASCGSRREGFYGSRQNSMFCALTSTCPRMPRSHLCMPSSRNSSR